MSAIGPYSLFFVTAVAHVLITTYAIFRSRQRAAKPASDRDALHDDAVGQCADDHAGEHVAGAQRDFEKDDTHGKLREHEPQGATDGGDREETK